MQRGQWGAWGGVGDRQRWRPSHTRPRGGILGPVGDQGLRGQKWPKAKRQQFIEALKITGGPTYAARRVGVPYSTVRDWYTKEPEFAAAWDGWLMEQNGDLEHAIIKGAIEGSVIRRYDKDGNLVSEETKLYPALMLGAAAHRLGWVTDRKQSSSEHHERATITLVGPGGETLSLREILAAQLGTEDAPLLPAPGEASLEGPRQVEHEEKTE